MNVEAQRRRPRRGEGRDSPSNPSPPAKHEKTTLAVVFLCFVEGVVDENRFRSKSDRVRLLGRIAQEDVDEGDARRARYKDVPSQSLSPPRKARSTPRHDFTRTASGRLFYDWWEGREDNSS